MNRKRPLFTERVREETISGDEIAQAVRAYVGQRFGIDPSKSVSIVFNMQRRRWSFDIADLSAEIRWGHS